MNNVRGICLIVILGPALMGCAGMMPEDKVVTPSLMLPRLVTQTHQLDGAIYAQDAPLRFLVDFRARGIGDIVMVNVVETSSGSKKASTKTSRSTDVEGGVTALLGFDKALEDKNSRFSADTMIAGSIKNDFDGSGSTSRNSSVTASISCRVVTVMPNGDLMISGSREIRVNNENQFMVLTGVIRPQDIAADNTILSSYIADARIVYNGRGVLSEKQSPGWLGRILDYVWPL
ncbi:MAG: flagellar basal body L-ring protein FlgH [Pseudomonadota bacterium]